MCRQQDEEDKGATRDFNCAGEKTTCHFIHVLSTGGLSGISCLHVGFSLDG
jgi:hypothetical protein